MKKLIMTTAIILGLSLTTFAQSGSMFHRENSGDNGSAIYESKGNDMFRSGFPGMPNHGETGNQDAPLGSGIALLTALGAAYLVGKRRKD